MTNKINNSAKSAEEIINEVRLFIKNLKGNKINSKSQLMDYFIEDKNPLILPYDSFIFSDKFNIFKFIFSILELIMLIVWPFNLLIIDFTVFMITYIIILSMIFEHWLIWTSTPLDVIKIFFPPTFIYIDQKQFVFSHWRKGICYELIENIDSLKFVKKSFYTYLQIHFKDDNSGMGSSISFNMYRYYRKFFNRTKEGYAQDIIQEIIEALINNLN